MNYPVSATDGRILKYYYEFKLKTTECQRGTVKINLKNIKLNYINIFCEVLYIENNCLSLNMIFFISNHYTLSVPYGSVKRL